MSILLLVKNEAKLTLLFPTCSHNNVFKDVYREVGILEVFVGCLVKYLGFLQKSVNVESGAHDIELTNESDIGNGNDSLIEPELNYVKIYFISNFRSK